MSWSVLLNYWSFEPTVIVPVALAALLYWIGEWKSAPRPMWRSLCYYAGLLVLFLALESPLDGLDGRLFWVHMLQHLLIIMVAAPLIILGNPALPLLKAWPLRPRRRVLKLVTTRSWSHTVVQTVSWLGSPWVVAVIFTADLYLWHWSPLFNLTLQNQGIHDLEHVCFLASALLLWTQVIDQKAVHVRMSYLQRAGYVVVVGAAGNLLAMYFVFVQRPLYSQYATLRPRPFGMGALFDQQLAGALMWVPVLFVFALAFSVCLYKWLGEESRSTGSEMITPAYRLLDGTLSTDLRSR